MAATKIKPKIEKIDHQVFASESVRKVVRDAFSKAIEVKTYPEESTRSRVVHAYIPGFEDKLDNVSIYTHFPVAWLTDDIPSLQSGTEALKMYEDMGEKLFWRVARNSTRFERLLKVYQKSRWERIKFAFSIIFDSYGKKI